MIRVLVAPSASSWSRTCWASTPRSPESMPDRAELRARRSPRRAAPPRRCRRCPPAGVVPAPERRDLRGERVALGVVQQREAVRAGAGGRDAVPLAGRRGSRWSRSRRCTPRGRPPPRPPRGYAASPSRCTAGRPRRQVIRRGRRGDRRVVVEDRQQQRLEQHRLGEGRLDDQQRGVGEVGLALGVAPDVAGEAVAATATPASARRRPGARGARRAPRRRTGTARSRRGRVRRRPPRRTGGPRGAGAGTARRPPAGGRCRRRAPPAAWSARSGR